jgi:hypothetical protein
MRKTKIALCLLLGILAGNAFPDLLLGIQRNHVTLSGSPVYEDDITAFSIGAYKSAMLPGLEKETKPNLGIAGYLEYSIWKEPEEARWMGGYFGSSYSSGIILFISLRDVINTGPGLGVTGLIPSSNTTLPKSGLFNTALIYSVALKIPETPISLGYKLQNSSLLDYFHFELANTTHEFYLSLDIGTLLSKPKTALPSDSAGVKK